MEKQEELKVGDILTQVVQNQFVMKVQVIELHDNGEGGVWAKTVILSVEPIADTSSQKH